ncbi:hypothetical protein [Bradyrhizobium oligotrophicum]|uniref:hypothetical protein n=1 Tax=Bradyrhizobium oligotrophicum TaxID=44255 RepID=UPI001181B18D|nr:hypothetical protein [Bradyrhizobium oligotrophicum]
MTCTEAANRQSLRASNLEGTSRCVGRSRVEGLLHSRANGGQHWLVNAMGRRRLDMRDVPETRRPLADVAAVAAFDPVGALCVLLVVGRFWKVGLILLVLIAAVMMTAGFLTFWMKHWDI